MEIIVYSNKYWRFKMDDIILKIYERIFFHCILHKVDIIRLSMIIEEEVEQYYAENNQNFPDSTKILLFVKLFAKRLGMNQQCLFSLDDYNSELLREEMLNYIAAAGKLLDYSFSEQTIFSYELINQHDIVTESVSFCNDALLTDSYIVNLIFDGQYYAMNVDFSGTFENSFINKNMVIWREKNGNLQNFIDALIDMKKIEYPELFQNTSKELIVYVFEDTETLPIMDKFEIKNEDRSYKYDSIVIQNGMRNWMPHANTSVYLHFVIKRPETYNYTGDITFTEFKQGIYRELRKHCLKELKYINLDEYLDSDIYFNFSIPYHFRAQNSSNRRGTTYGETEDYTIVGAYISSRYTYTLSDRTNYKRNLFNNADSDILCKNILSTEYSSNSPDIDEMKTDTHAAASINVSFDDSAEKAENYIFEEDITEEPESFIYDIQKLQENADRICKEGSWLTYKDLRTEEIHRSVIDTKKFFLHQSFVGQKAGSIIFRNGRGYLIIEVQ